MNHEYNLHLQIEPEKDFILKRTWEHIQAANPIDRILFIMAFLFMSCAIVISVFRKNEINYFHIFQFSMKHKMQQYQFWALTSFFIFLFTFTLALRITREFLNHNATKDLDNDKIHDHTEKFHMG